MTGRPTPKNMAQLAASGKIGPNRLRVMPHSTGTSPAKPLTEAQQHLEKCISEALQEFDAGGIVAGTDAFLADVQRNAGTEKIASNLLFVLKLAEMDETTTRQQFEQFLRGCRV
ncbi:hypothetical protein [Shimazuella kribbensis]|uniref:hypothetical protein n=1 Tax=Shimazuella kribbensis TaxID=139808 RepID=UPI00048AD697|nr:hypothetical protein [Shimazuella kribbensis]